MRQEEAFWRAITAEVRDRLPRLVFADWVEERGRYLLGEAIRATIDLSPEPRTWKGWCKEWKVSGDRHDIEGWYWVCDRARVNAFPSYRTFALPLRVWQLVPGKPQWLWYKRNDSPRLAFTALWEAWVAHHHPDEACDLWPDSLFAEASP